MFKPRKKYLTTAKYKVIFLVNWICNGLCKLRRARRPPNRPDHRIGNGQHLTSRAELLERGIMGQLVRGAERQQLSFQK